jgi:hypothetical protein
LQRKAQWRLDFVAAENSMGFHAPQEAARILAEAIDYARQGELAVARDRVSIWPAQARTAGARAPRQIVTCVKAPRRATN